MDLQTMNVVEYGMRITTVVAVLAVITGCATRPAPVPIPAGPPPQAQDSVPLGDWRSFPEVKVDLPIASGRFEPTWASIEKNYPGEPTWLRDAKFGIWVHFGPQSAGESGDWYARNLYKPGPAYRNHLRRYGHPSEVGYKEVLRDWFYAPGFTYDSGMMIRYIIEAIARDGNAALCISMLPDGSLDEGSLTMLKEVGVWMRCNGKAVYGSRAWTIPGEGEIVNGRLKMLPGGKLGRNHANFQFSPQDFRFTVGKNGEFYAFCLTVPAPGPELKIKSLGTDSNHRSQPIKSVKLLGHDGELKWKQEAGGLAITCPAEMPFATAITFRIK